MTPDPVSELLAKVCALPALPGPRLTPNERRRRGGRILPIGPSLVAQVALSLQGAPELHPAHPGAGAALTEAHAQALRCLALRHVLLDLAEQAQDRYLTLAAQSVDQALAILKDAAEPRGAIDAEQAEARRLQLLPALRLKLRYEGRVQKERAARRSARRDALRLAAPGPEGAAPAPAAPPRRAEARRQQLRAARQDRDAARARLSDQFEAHLQRLRRTPGAAQACAAPADAATADATTASAVAAAAPGAAARGAQSFPMEIAPAGPIFLKNEAGPGRGLAERKQEQRMDAREQKLIEEFMGRQDLQRQAPSLSAVYQKTTEELGEGLARARALLARRPRTELSEEQRAVLTERLPLFGAVAAAFVEAMRGDEDPGAPASGDAGAGAEVTVRAADLAEAAHLERALSRLVFSTQVLREGADNGALIAGATAATLCQGALRHYQAQAADTSLPEAARRGVQALCAEALRIDAEGRKRQAEEKAADDRNAAPYLQAISESQRRAEAARLIESYLADSKQRSRP